ncbi:MAG: hypothetical protein B6241_15485 [Spirochaetaceae bacterium 4572_59]|nr:MAG: hypothetical protein B6241_15485 [Spirochaetaceae bacterium 4572_59]
MKNPAASIQARLLNLSRKEKKDFVLISRLYMQEGILRRIGQSKFTESFYLKGDIQFFPRSQQYSRKALAQILGIYNYGRLS